MTPFEEYKNITTHKDRLFKSWWRIQQGFGTSEAWWENIGKWKSPDKLNEGIWHRLREVDWNREQTIEHYNKGITEKDLENLIKRINGE